MIQRARRPTPSDLQPLLAFSFVVFLVAIVVLSAIMVPVAIMAFVAIPVRAMMSPFIPRVPVSGPMGPPAIVAALPAMLLPLVPGGTWGRA